MWKRVWNFIEEILADIAAQGLLVWLKGWLSLTALALIYEWIKGRSPLEFLFLAAAVVAVFMFALNQVAAARSRWRRRTSPKTSASSDVTEPTPRFLCPRQGARESYLSWWHIPVSVDHGQIEHCTVEFWASTNPPPITLRWRSDAAVGSDEVTLLEGRTKLIPVVIRCEAGALAEPRHNNIRDGVARITGAAYLVYGEINKFRLPANQLVFKLRVRSGKKQWESQEYIMKLPESRDSNGQFVVEVWHGGRD
ncbi:MAG: hypothetical protein WD715_16985 [Dongiaceae bacterium]